MNRRYFSLSSKLTDVVQIGCGDLCDLDDGKFLVSKDLDFFSLHDSMLYKYDADLDIDKKNRITIYGLLPCFSSTFKVSFFDVSDFIFRNVDFLDFFSVRSLALSQPERLHACFVGEFEDHYFSFSFSSASFSKYSLRSPISRRDLGL